MVPKDVQGAMEVMDIYHDKAGAWQTLRAHIAAQDAEITRHAEMVTTLRKLADNWERRSHWRHEMTMLDDLEGILDMFNRVHGDCSDTYSHRKCAEFVDTHAAEIKRNAEDAVRYRFLRDKQATIIYKRVGFGEWEPLIDTFETSTRSASLDAAIDAAMQANAEVKG